MLIDTRGAEHRELETQAGALLRVVAAQAPDSASVAGMRWRMARALSDYLAQEDRRVRDARLRQEDGMLAKQFHGYILDWPVSRITGDWAAFGRATQAVLASIADRMTGAGSPCYPHADRVPARRAA
ncbi:hypothetical protein LQ953_11210 [Sphingomonas sp. IC-56]|uniref:hypothetical protein n=1 Tax=Sphingomonas sp. IC-56 TaxID=2898529 RepID=UPI001E46A61B|nr:hypothetical protein [Sphingomonas sp. IC-56]MCD2324581.1 hypothetical protein [Sphingomonas sp. IC-56]